jgi:hypothetical protein
MHKPMKWLLEARSSDGFWHQTDRPDRRKSEWITEAALNTLRRWADSLDGKPIGASAVKESRRVRKGVGFRPESALWSGM